MSDELPDLTSLDAAYTLPDWVTDQGLRGLYDILLERLRREARGLPMTTAQTLLIERIAFYYIVMKSKERFAVGSGEGFSNASQQKDFTTFWLSMTKEFNAVVARASKSDRDSVMTEVKDIILKASKVIKDKSVRDEFLTALSDEIENAGV